MVAVLAAVGTLGGVGGIPLAAAASPDSSPMTCTGPEVLVVDQFYPDLAVNGATPPSVSTGGKAYCITQVATYHWNGGQGAPTAGTIGLRDSSGKFIGGGPWKATATPATNNILANWQLVVPTSPPVVIDGTYTVVDSDPATWSSSQRSGGGGFVRIWCQVAIPVAAAASASSAPPASTPPGTGSGVGPTPEQIALAAASAVIVVGLVMLLLRWRRGRKRKGTVEYTYQCSLHCDLDPKAYRGGLGHAWADLQRTKITKDEQGKVVSTEPEETEYDFAPAGNASTWDTVVGGTPGKVLPVHRRGGPPATGTNEYYEITKDGYDQAKAWADGTVTSPPTYRAITYNCVDYSLELCRRAGAPIPDGAGAMDESNFYLGGLANTSTPSNLVAAILDQRKKRTCTHKWHRDFLVSHVVVCTIVTCELCGARYMEKP
jgi:hypothetical protein